MQLEQQNCHSGLMQYVDARIKIICAIIWSFFMASVQSIPMSLYGLGVAIVLIVLAQWSVKDLVRRLALVNIFTVLMWCLVPFAIVTDSRPATEPLVAQYGFLAVTKQGFDLMVLISIKINAIIISLLALLATCPLFTLAQAGIKLGFSTKLVNLFLLTIRYIYVIFNEFSTLCTAMKLRGFRFNLSKHGLVGIANLIGVLLLRSMDRAERVHFAMLCRGYTGTIWVHTDFKLRWTDIIFFVLMCTVIITMGVCLWVKV